jgi:tetratricopeptide (TPR) repeat protein
LAKAAEKVTRKEVGASASVSEAFRPLATGLEENWKTILVVAGAALVALVVLALVLQIQSRHREDAAQSVGDALTDVGIPVVAAPEPGEPAEPGEAGTEPGSEKAPKVPAAPQKPGAQDANAKPSKPAQPAKPAKSRIQTKDDFPSEQAKQEAIAKQAQATIAEFGSQPAARVARLTLGDADYKLGKYQDAVESYSRFLADAPEGDYMRAYGQVGMAYGLMGLGKKDEALAAAKALVEHPPGGFGRDLGLLTEGHLAEDLGQPEVAKQVYRLLRGEAPDSSAGREAGERLTFLGEPPTPPKPAVPAQAAQTSPPAPLK